MSQVQIRPVQLKPEMVVRVHHFMRHGVLDVAPALDAIRAQQDAVRRVEPALLLPVAPAAVDVGRGKPAAAAAVAAAELLEVRLQEPDDGAVGEQEVAVGLAARAIGGLVADVLVAQHGVDAGAGHAAGHVGVQVRELREERRARGVAVVLVAVAGAALVRAGSRSLWCWRWR